MNYKFTRKTKTSMVTGGDDHQTIGVPGKSIGISDHLSKQSICRK